MEKPGWQKRSVSGARFVPPGYVSFFVAPDWAKFTDSLANLQAEFAMLLKFCLQWLDFRPRILADL
jgi:hypothetical protein